MKHLFFDIECANCDEGRGKICSFGYVLCDEELNISQKDDIVINPDAPFHLTGRRDKRDIVLSYPKEFFDAQPKFPYFAEKIFSLLTDKETMVWGYAVINDVNFLLSECDRYRIKMPDFVYYDVQLLYADFLSVKNVMSLERAVGELGIAVQEEHNSMVDAENTMSVARGVCQKLGLKLDTVMQLSTRVKGEIKNGVKMQMSETPKKKFFDEKKKEIFSRPVEFGNGDIEKVKKARRECFDTYNAKKKILHNYDSGVKASSTIGELLKDSLKLGE